MIGPDAIAEIVQTYGKHGWVLRRVLLSVELKQHLGDSIMELFGEVPVSESDIDAAWFSRPPKRGGVAWEIRHLTETPYALLEVLDENEADFEVSLQKLEARLRENVTGKTNALTSGNANGKL
jgi:hypothetical protein